MSVEFYFSPLSAPCRAIQMAAAAAGVELIEKPINLMAKEQLSPEYIKMNPQHTIPTIKDGDFVLWESRPIMGYLINKYGKDDRYYPQDPVKRAIVDQRLYFDMGVLYKGFAEYFYPQILAKAPADPEKFKKIEEAFGFLNTFLEGSKYAAGDHLTIADFALLATVSSAVDGGANFSLEPYPNVKRWYADAKANAPGYEKTIGGLEMVKGYFASINSTN